MTRKKVDRERRRNFGRSFHLSIEATYSGSLLSVMAGVEKILRYSQEELVLKAGHGVVRIVGREILCRTFSSGLVEIRGDLESVCFLNGNEMPEDENVDR